MDTLFYVYPVMERLEDVLVRKFRTLSRAARAFGKHQTYFYNIVSLGKSTTINRLNDYAKLADVSLAYLLYGENLIYGSRSSYSPVSISFTRLVSLWKALPHDSGKLIKDSVYISGLARGKNKTVRLTTLFYYADLFKLSAMELCQE